MAEKITREFRLNIVQTMKQEGIHWAGKLTDTDFLSRIYDLEKIPSNDDRYDDIRGDIFTHSYTFHDWENDWIFSDERFNLMRCPDKEFLNFLCETIHPIVRSNETERKNLLDLYNNEIAEAGYKIEEKESTFGNKHYQPIGIIGNAIETLEDIPDIKSELNSENIRKHVTRMMTNLDSDPELVIGTAKEFIESIFKTFLKIRNIEYADDGKLSRLATLVFNEIKKVSDEKEDAKANKITKQILRVLSALVQDIAEMRNAYGSGHGKEPDKNQLGTIHASLAANIAATIGNYMFQTYEKYFKDKDS